MPLRIRNERWWQSVDIEVTLRLVQSVQIRLHRGIVNTEKFIRRGHHVNLVRLRFLSMNWYTGSFTGAFCRYTPISRKRVLRSEAEPRLEILRL